MLGENHGGAARSSVGDEGGAIGLAAGNRDKGHSRRNLPAVGGKTRDVDVAQRAADRSVQLGKIGPDEITQFHGVYFFVLGLPAPRESTALSIQSQ